MSFKIYQKTIEFETEKDEIKDITDIINNILSELKAKNGLINILTQHTTNSLYLNENEKFLFEDITNYLSEQVLLDKEYKHDNIAQRDCPKDEPINAHSHIKSMFYGQPELTLPYVNKKLELGTYQRVIFTEFDGPCPRPGKTNRKLKLTIISD